MAVVVDVDVDVVVVFVIDRMMMAPNRTDIAPGLYARASLYNGVRGLWSNCLFMKGTRQWMLSITDSRKKKTVVPGHASLKVP